MAGFAEMEEEDRVALFRQGSFEVIMARYTPLLTSDGMFTPDMTVLIPRYSYSIYAPRFKSSFYLSISYRGQLSMLCSLSAQLIVKCYCL